MSATPTRCGKGGPAVADEQIKAYLLDNYGSCKATTCACRIKGPWLGRMCEQWVPTGATTWGAMRTNLRVLVEQRRQK